MLSIRMSRPDDEARLFGIWRQAVLATHDFLSPSDFREIEALVSRDYLPNACLHVAADAADMPVGFMGMSEAHIDSLFVDPARRGQGIGRMLVEHARAEHPGLTVDVNARNRQAVGFYERMGFRVVGRTETDDAGRPYPLLLMRLGQDL